MKFCCFDVEELQICYYNCLLKEWFWPCGFSCTNYSDFGCCCCCLVYWDFFRHSEIRKKKQQVMKILKKKQRNLPPEIPPPPYQSFT